MNASAIQKKHMPSASREGHPQCTHVRKKSGAYLRIENDFCDFIILQERTAVSHQTTISQEKVCLAYRCLASSRQGY